MPVGVTIKTRRGTAAEWSAANPTLAAGEPGYETDTGILKYGDGVTAYNSLPARVPTSQKTTRSATIVIAASDSSEKSKAQADYVCDGVNDQVEITAAMEALPAAGGLILLSEGTFSINDMIVPLNYVHIKGAGMHQTKLKGASTMANSVFKRMAITTPASTTDSPMTGVILEDFEIDGSEMLLDGVDGAPGGTWGGGKGTYFSYLKHCTFRNLYVHDTPASGLGNDYHEKCTYENCIVIGAGRGEPTGPGGGASSGGHGFGIGTGAWTEESVTLANCYAENCWFGGYSFEAVEPVTYAKYMTMANCYSAGNRVGLYIQSNDGVGTSKAKITGCSFVDNAETGIFLCLDTLDIIISDCTIEGNGQDGILSDDKDIKNIIIHDCIINRNARSGIYTENGHMSIHNNLVYENGNTGMFIRADVGNISRINIMHNMVYNNGTDGVVGENDGIRVLPTGSYTIRDVRITGNRCWDDQTTKTQRYGVVMTGDIDYVYVVGNDLRDNATGNYLNTATGVNNIVIDGTQ